MTNLVTFDYVDAKGKQSHRTVAATSMPNTFIKGYDIGDLDHDMRLEFLEAIQELQEAYKAELQAIAEAYDLKYSFRQFSESGVSHLEVQTISAIS
jgi:hypothetical protein